MTRNDTLIPYVRRQEKESHPIIIVDNHEASSASKIRNALLERGAEVRTHPLSKGDYVLSESCAVERKTVHDFVYTLTRRYLFDQLYGLKDLYSTAIMLLEGYLPIIYKFTHVTPSAVWGAMYALAKHGISVVNTANYNETADFLYTAARQEQIVERRTLRIHAEKKIDTLSDAQLYFVASLPNIGRERARAILKSYRKPLLAFINVDDWAKQIRGLGPKISSKAREILNTEFED